MPELPEVETVRRGLERQTRGLRIEKVQVLRASTIASPEFPEYFCKALEKTTLVHWTRRGKYLLASLRGPQGSPAGSWGVHLRMTGQFLWLENSQPPCRHTRVRLWNREGEELRFVDVRSFAQMWWVAPNVDVNDVITGLRKLGPEPFSDQFHANYLQHRLRGSRRPIKNALLDQSLVAGVGNIYADEALFRAGILPYTISGSLKKSRLERLRLALVDVLEASIGAGGTTFRDFRDLKGTNGNYGGLAWVYGRGGQPCRRCGTVIRRDKLAGRSCHWCNRCQS